MRIERVTRAGSSLRVACGLLALAALASGCGGSGGSGSGDTLQGLVLVDFLQSGQDNLPLNRTLEFRFSSVIDPDTVGPASLSIREGPGFGAAVDGHYVVQGDRVFFEPRIPGRCDLTDSGLLPETEYRVTLIGSPEEFAIRNLAGEPLQATLSLGFSTRLETDPELFEDQIPGELPTVVATTPVDGTPSIPVGNQNEVRIVFSENLNPCTVDDSTITLFQYATGDIVNGFVPPTDAAPSDDFSWGSGAATLPPRRILCTYTLEQSLLTTTLTLTPNFGEFPDNALLVCQVTSQVKDFGGNPLVPFTFSFTTENRPPQTKARVFEFDGDVPVITADTTAEVNTARAPSRVQGYLLVSGDGDNGANLLIPSGPDNSKGPPGCIPVSFQPNDSIQDDFDPVAPVLLSTGATKNQCFNSVDGSTAVVFEFRTLRIRNGITVRLTGVNPAIILVRGDVVIESGGTILARGDGQAGQPNSQGSNGASQNLTAQPLGGVGVAGGGNGGQVSNTTDGTVTTYGGNGHPGYASDDYGVAPGVGGAGTPVLVGPGRGSVSSAWITSPQAGNRGGTSGGGGGHGKAGGSGTSLGTGSSPITLQNAFVDGAGGGTYGDLTGSMPTAEAGSGGGAGGNLQNAWSGYTSYQYYSGTGGAGGAGGGFVDITSSADIRVFGTIDAAGGRGGNGVAGYGFYPGGGGGGGGSGGGIRLLTPSNIILASGARLTAAGGLGGAGHVATNQPPPVNNGATGGVGRLVLEDIDGVIDGIAGAQITPAESANTGSDKVFFRGVFNGARFQGGGLTPAMVSDLIDIGPFAPDYFVASQDYNAAPGTLPPAPRIDFSAGIPNVASRGIGSAAIFIEAQGYPSNADGTPNLALPTGWKSVGTFVDSGSEPFPTWIPDSKPNAGDVPPGQLLPGNTGDGIDLLDGKQFFQFRVTFFLPGTVGPFDAGPYIDRWTLWFSYDQ